MFQPAGSGLAPRQKTTNRGVYLTDLRICFHLGLVEPFDFRGSILVAATQLDDVREVAGRRRAVGYACGQLKQARINGSLPRRLDFRFLNVEVVDDERVGGEDSRARSHISDGCPALAPCLSNVTTHGHL